MTSVPATLTFLLNEGYIPSAPAESRFDQSHREVRDASDEALAGISEALQAVEEAFENGSGRKVMREVLRDLHYKVKNAPANMEFVAKSLTEHVENVVTKARADIEGMALAAQERSELSATSLPQLDSGEDESDPYDPFADDEDEEPDDLG